MDLGVGRQQFKVYMFQTAVIQGLGLKIEDAGKLRLEAEHVQLILFWGSYEPVVLK